MLGSASAQHHDHANVEVSGSKGQRQIPGWGEEDRGAAGRPVITYLPDDKTRTQAPPGSSSRQTSNRGAPCRRRASTMAATASRRQC